MDGGNIDLIPNVNIKKKLKYTDIILLRVFMKGKENV